MRGELPRSITVRYLKIRPVNFNPSKLLRDDDDAPRTLIASQSSCRSSITRSMPARPLVSRHSFCLGLETLPVVKHSYLSSRVLNHFIALRPPLTPFVVVVLLRSLHITVDLERPLSFTFIFTTNCPESFVALHFCHEIARRTDLN